MDIDLVGKNRSFLNPSLRICLKRYFCRKKRMKVLFVLLGSLAMMACSRTNELCHCIHEADELNKLSNELLYAEEVSAEQQAELNQLRKHIDSLCAPFYEMGPEEMYKMRNECIDQDLLDMQK